MEPVGFDIVAKYPPDTKSDNRSLMLRTMLEDRFTLAVHRESKDLAGYALVVAKRFKLKPVEPGGSSTDSNGGRVVTLTAKKTSLAQLADIVARNLGQTVVDRTGIPGVYDFDLRWTNEDQTPDGAGSDAAPTLFTALQETLGLRLRPHPRQGGRDADPVPRRAEKGRREKSPCEEGELRLFSLPGRTRACGAEPSRF